MQKARAKGRFQRLWNVNKLHQDRVEKRIPCGSPPIWNRRGSLGLLFRPRVGRSCQGVFQACRGNAAISKDVLAAFRKLTKDTVVWDRSTKPWWKRNAYDQPDSHRQDS